MGSSVGTSTSTSDRKPPARAPALRSSGKTSSSPPTATTATYWPRVATRAGSSQIFSAELMVTAVAVKDTSTSQLPCCYFFLLWLLSVDDFIYQSVHPS